MRQTPLANISIELSKKSELFDVQLEYRTQVENLNKHFLLSLASLFVDRPDFRVDYIAAQKLLTSQDLITREHKGGIKDFDQFPPSKKWPHLLAKGQPPATGMLYYKDTPLGLQAILQDHYAASVDFFFPELCEVSSINSYQPVRADGSRFLSVYSYMRSLAAHVDYNNSHVDEKDGNAYTLSFIEAAERSIKIGYKRWLAYAAKIKKKNLYTHKPALLELQAAYPNMEISPGNAKVIEYLTSLTEETKW